MIITRNARILLHCFSSTLPPLQSRLHMCASSIIVHLFADAGNTPPRCLWLWYPDASGGIALHLIQSLCSSRTHWNLVASCPDFGLPTNDTGPLSRFTGSSSLNKPGLADWSGRARVAAITFNKLSSRTMHQKNTAHCSSALYILLLLILPEVSSCNRSANSVVFAICRQPRKPFPLRIYPPLRKKSTYACIISTINYDTRSLSIHHKHISLIRCFEKCAIVSDG